MINAAILVEQNKELAIEKISFPDRLSYGQVLVRIVCSGICGSQLGEIDGVKGPDPFLPHLLGHEGGGVVEEIGSGVSKVKVGDHVVMHWRRGCGIESAPPKYRWGKHIVNAGWVTTFNDYAVISENRLTPIPKEVDLEIAALLGCAVTTGFGVVNNDAQLKLGESVVVLGVGSVGINIIQGAALVSAYPIIAVDLYDHKLNQAKIFGATHAINASNKDVKEEILNIVGTQGADVVIDNTGNAKVIELGYDVTSSVGRTVLVGVMNKKDKISIYTLPLHFEKKLLGSHGGNSFPSRDIPNYLKLVTANKIKIKEIISHRFYLSEINSAIEKIRKGEVGKCIVNTFN